MWLELSCHDVVYKIDGQPSCPKNVIECFSAKSIKCLYLVKKHCSSIHISLNCLVHEIMFTGSYMIWKMDCVLSSIERQMSSLSQFNSPQIKFNFRVGKHLILLCFTLSENGVLNHTTLLFLFFLKHSDCRDKIYYYPDNIWGLPLGDERLK